MCSLALAVSNRPPPDPAAAALDALEQEICTLAAHIAAATCRWLLLIARFDALEGWAQSGVLSCAHWLSWRCSITPRAAREHVRVARALAGLPLIQAAFAVGELSYSKVRALTRVAEPETEADLLELARHATGAQLEKLVRGYGGALAATLDAVAVAHEARSVSWYWGEDGMLRLQARLPAEEGALVLAALGAAEPDGDRVDVGHARADALVATARAALAGEGAERRGGDPCEMVVHVDALTLASERIADRCELEDGPSLTPETARRLACDAAVVRIVERDGEPLTVGRRTRTIPSALRRALRSRDDGCRWPGCTHRRFLHAHHIRHWERGGATELGNLVQLCSHHHRLVHEGGFTVERAGPRGLRFRRPGGALIAAGPSRARGDGFELVREHRAKGLAFSAETCRPRSAGDRVDYDMAVMLLCHARESPG